MASLTHKGSMVDRERVLCGIGYGELRPLGHVWSGDPAHVTCPDCLLKMGKRLQLSLGESA